MTMRIITDALHQTLMILVFKTEMFFQRPFHYKEGQLKTFRDVSKGDTICVHCHNTPSGKTLQLNI
ncbi:CLUMA_CG004975, isoform A [Clunio marinus]|uniref:CLUMA_CG004975, isoform A n=1 Tax=Clunio marinus TaxID=568069 RepID=A0A1J1HYU7_9DIPT|nr:CLUMA_CG004975, isoform A [Clunio marinus]